METGCLVKSGQTITYAVHCFRTKTRGCNVL